MYYDITHTLNFHDIVIATIYLLNLLSVENKICFPTPISIVYVTVVIIKVRLDHLLNFLFRSTEVGFHALPLFPSRTKTKLFPG